jgi:acyl-CoA reductase-like NAD-dependent aldehyde dehydrogenase
MERIEILKTYKIYIGGQFPRTESGRYYNLEDKSGQLIANVCLSSRKDVRNAVVAARKALGTWSERPAFNRGQILYRIAEMLEGRKAQFVEELMLQGLSVQQAKTEVEQSVDRLVYYSGWCDKFQQIYSSVNPVASSHFNFSALEPVGVVGAIVPENNSLIGLVSVVAPIIAGGNTVVLLASEKMPLCAITFAEVINSSDVPAGVVNILTGTEKELASHFASHMDINALAYARDSKETFQKLQELAVDSVKRVFDLGESISEKEGPAYIKMFQEVKTTWHPIENIGGAVSTY